MVKISGKMFFVDVVFFYSGSFCLHPLYCRNALGELLKTKVFSKGDWVGERSSGLRSLSDIYFRCNGCLKLEDDFLHRQIAFLPFCVLSSQISHVLSKLMKLFGMGIIAHSL